MATNTRQARKDAEKKRECYFNNYMAQFCCLFDNSVEIENLPSDLPKRYLLRILRNKGGIAFDKQTKLFLPYVEKGIDVYGLPLEYTLIGFNGFVVSRKPNEVVILRANDLKFPLDKKRAADAVRFLFVFIVSLNFPFVIAGWKKRGRDSSDLQ